MRRDVKVTTYIVPASAADIADADYYAELALYAITHPPTPEEWAKIQARIETEKATCPYVACECGHHE